MTNPYEAFTARIIESLKAGIIPWAKPWKGNSPFPRNFRTGAPYRGANVLILWSSSYTSPYWLTYKQAQELGGNVRKGEKGTQILFWKISKRDPKATKPTEAEGNDDKDRKSFFCRAYTVFNVEQCDGLKAPEAIATFPEVPQDERCEAIVTEWADRPQLELDNAHEAHAYYRPSSDCVHMPIRKRFVDAPHYYATLFHELIHSTGHESRLNRTLSTTFGAEPYCKEELIAEVGSSFLCAIAGITNERTEQNSTAYIQNWIETLKGDSRLVVTAASAAQKAADAILGKAFEDEGEESTEGEGEEDSAPVPLPLAA